MKRSLISLLLIFILIVNISFVLSDNHTTINDSVITSTDSTDTNSKVSDGYKCLEDTIDNKDCEKLSSRERIFALLAAGECKSDVVDDSANDKCWPDRSCDVKTTAQALLALDRTTFDTEEAEEWLIDQNDTTDEFNWYLQIESNSETDCDITYDDSTHSTKVLSDKKMSSSAGSCLTIESGKEWWLKVAPKCYGDEFEISCEKDFSTNLLFKQKTSSTFHVSENTHSSSAEGTTTETVESVCLKDGNSCDYEGTLWGTMVLEKLGYDISAYLPYLVVMAEDYDELLPEAFLYKITENNDFKEEVLSKQESGKYWDESGSKFYDTAVALLPFKLESPTEKDNAIDWLLEVQGKDGCWDNGNVLSTAFVLHAAWPKDLSFSQDTDDDCETNGNFCTSSLGCQEAGGSALTGYSCPGALSCCDTQPTLQTCSELGGQICNSAQTICSGGGFQSASGLSLGDQCCVGGFCSTASSTSPECEQQGGTCRSLGCSSDETEETYDCDSSSASCCFEKEEKSSAWIWWIIIFIILIAILVLAIIFRERLKVLWIRIKTKLKKGKGPKTPPKRFGPGRGPIPSSRIPQGGPRRRMIIPRRPVPLQRKPPKKAKPKKPGELDDVLKKLRDMSK